MSGWRDLDGVYHEGNPYILGHCKLHPGKCWPDSAESQRNWILRRAANDDGLSDDAFVVVSRVLRGDDIEAVPS